MRFEEFHRKVVRLNYGEPARNITGELVKETKDFITLQTFNQKILIAIKDIVTLQPARRDENWGNQSMR